MSIKLKIKLALYLFSLLFIINKVNEKLAKKEVIKLEAEAEKLEKCEWMLKHIAEEKYKIEAMENQKRNLEKMIKTKKNIVERLSKYIAIALDYQKFETSDGLAKISYRTNKDKVTIDDINMIPIEYFKTPRNETYLSKTAIKEAIASGDYVPGVHLEDNISIIVKG